MAAISMTTVTRSPLALDVVQYRIDRPRNTVFFTLRGDVTFVDLCEVQEEMLSDPDYSSDMSIYVDCRVVTSIPTREQIRKLALDRTWWRATMPIGRLVIVPMTRMGFEYANAWADFLDESESRFAVFTTHEQAAAWLGIPMPESLRPTDR
jgi:hypothetical protein